MNAHARKKEGRLLVIIVGAGALVSRRAIICTDFEFRINVSSMETTGIDHSVLSNIETSASSN